MPAAPQHLEPAVRDPRKLRNTALILVALIFVSAIGIFLAYVQLSKTQNVATRPHIVGRLNENLGVIRQDGVATGFDPLDGKVWVAAAVCVNQPDSWKRSREVMQRLAKHYEGNPNFHLVCITVDPDKETPEVLAKAAQEIGAKLPQWWFVAAGREFTHKYLKDKFQLGSMPSEVDGKWEYNSKILVVDRNRHLRTGKVGKFSIEFDFDNAAKWDAEGRKSGSEKSNVEQMEIVLIQTIDAVMAEQVGNKL